MPSFQHYRYKDAATVINRTAALQLIQHERQKTMPKIPDTLVELTKILPDVRLAQKCYYGYFIDDDGKCGLVFSSNTMMNILRKNSREIYIDGTFNVSQQIL